MKSLTTIDVSQTQTRGTSVTAWGGTWRQITQPIGSQPLTGRVGSAVLLSFWLLAFSSANALVGPGAISDCNVNQAITPQQNNTYISSAYPFGFFLPGDLPASGCKFSNVGVFVQDLLDATKLRVNAGMTLIYVDDNKAVFLGDAHSTTGNRKAALDNGRGYVTLEPQAAYPYSAATVGGRSNSPWRYKTDTVNLHKIAGYAQYPGWDSSPSLVRQIDTTLYFVDMTKPENTALFGVPVMSTPNHTFTNLEIKHLLDNNPEGKFWSVGSTRIAPENLILVGGAIEDYPPPYDSVSGSAVPVVPAQHQRTYALAKITNLSGRYLHINSHVQNGDGLQCNGDSGGPVVLEDINGEMTLMATMSLLSNCFEGEKSFARADLPEVRDMITCATDPLKTIAESVQCIKDLPPLNEM